MEKSSPIINPLTRFAAGRQCCVLLVEDDGNDVELIQRAFKDCGCPVTLHVAYNGQAAIDHLIAAAGNGSVPELILSDIKMPIMDGFELLRWLKPKSAHRRIPVIMLSASGMDGDIGRAYDLGAAAYLVKPTSFGELDAAVRAMLVFWMFADRRLCQMGKTSPCALARTVKSALPERMQRSESNSKRPQTWTRYGVAILAVVAAAGLRLLLDPVLGENLPFPTFFAAILIAVWFGGFGPGLLALVLGFFAADFLFVNVRSRNERRPLSLG